MLKLKLIKKEPLKLKITSSFPSIILANLQDKTVKPSEEEQVITADDGFDGLREVTVEAMTPTKYAPRFISFYGYSSSDLSYEIDNLDTKNITNFSEMFSHCSFITKLDLKNFNTSNSTNMSGMFTYCSKLTSIDVSSFDTSKVTNMSNMFNRNTVLERLDLSNFQTNNVTNINYIFADCKALTHLDIRNMTFNKVSFSINAFKEVPSNCEIIVKSDTERAWILNVRSDFTNIKTVAEL